MAKIEVYVDENSKTIFKELNKYINKLKISVIEQDKKREYYIQREISIHKECVDKELLKLPKIYRLIVKYKNTEWKFYLKNYEDVKNKIMEILKNGLYLFIDEKTYIFDYFKIDVFKVEND